jgi:hypothetical protein
VGVNRLTKLSATGSSCGLDEAMEMTMVVMVVDNGVDEEVHTGHPSPPYTAPSLYGSSLYNYSTSTLRLSAKIGRGWKDDCVKTSRNPARGSRHAIR